MKKFPTLTMFLALIILYSKVHAEVHLHFEANNADHVGAWGVFKPDGNMDWHWVLNLELNQDDQIDSITMLHAIPGEAWSTASDYFYGKGLYPLGVFYKGKQLNFTSDQPLGRYKKGSHQFDLFGAAGTMFSGSKVYVVFDNGTLQTASVESPTGDKELSHQIYSEMWRSRETKVSRKQKEYFDETDFPDCSEEAPFDLGRIWIEEEGPFQGTWTRRGKSNIFDAQWTSENGDVTDEIKFVSVDRYYVKLHRKGQASFYHGILSCDKKMVTQGTGDGFSYGGVGWTAKIIQ